MSQPLSVFIIAGEPSGDKLGGALMAGLGQLEPVEFHGVGGPQMIAQGLSSLFPMSDLSVMGLLEVLPRVPKLLARVRQTANAIKNLQPDVLITIDSPDFCLRVAAKARASLPGLKVVHYVAPSVWAWRPERAERMAQHVDHVLALLPFEPPYMQAAGMSCDFVGHPLVAEPLPSEQEMADLAHELGVNPQTEKLVCLLPGSRKGEIARLAPVYRDVAQEVAQELPDVRFVLPMSSAVAAEVRRSTAYWPVKPVLLDPKSHSAEHSEARKRAVFHMCHAALATSGTVALELAAASCPMVVAYKANYLTTRMVKKMAQIDTANLVNIVTESRVIPEFLFEDCTAKLIIPELLELLKNPDSHDAQLQACKQTLLTLGLGDEDPGLRAAKSVLKFIR
ncbi:MAG: lipid-A-disaccharide synthase [Rhodobacteraceae bacterium]|nr:lipid-A-disaccharide synthase [Paracoccaceae bacterium]